MQFTLLLLVKINNYLFSLQPLSHEAENPSNVISETSFKKKLFYNFRIFPGKWIKVWCDRLTLLALLDKYVYD